MEGYDLDTLTGFLAAVWQLISGVLRLNPQAYRVALALPEGWQLALIILFLAGLSYTLGHSVVLFANRVNRRHFIFALSVSSLTLVASVFFWGVTIWLIAGILVDHQQPFTNVLAGYLIWVTSFPKSYEFGYFWPSRWALLSRSNSASGRHCCAA
jgi:hypothetical protein